MDAMTASISAAAGLLCLIAAVLFWTVGGRHTPRVTVVLVVVGIASILGTPVGGWLRTAVAWLDGLAATVTGALAGTVIVGLVFLVAAYWLCVHVYRRTVTGMTLACAVIAPVAVLSMPGIVGTVASTVISTAAGGVGWGISALFGLG